MNGIEFREPFNISYDNIHVSDAFLHAIDERGLIVAGYPGVGKSSIAHGGRFIDLESSMFRDAAGIFDEWSYVRTAIFLASQGHTVLTSTHSTVIKLLEKFFDPSIPHAKEITKYTSKALGAVIFCPDPQRDHQELWLEKLNERYKASGLEKDKRAYDRCMRYWREDLEELCNSRLPVYHPAIIECMKEHGLKPNLELEIRSIKNDLITKEREKNDESGENQEC